MRTRRGSPEWKAKLSKAQRRYRTRQRERQHLRPSHVDRWIRKGEIAESLRHIVRVRASQAEQMTEDMGGDVTQMQRACIEVWLQAQVAADAYFLAFVRDGVFGSRATDRLAGFLNASRSALTTIGLERQARDVIDIQGYMEAKGNGDRAPNANVGASA